VTLFATAVKQIVQEFALSEEEILRQSLRAFLLDRVQLLESERQARCARFGVSSLEEMDTLIRNGSLEEEDILEDFQNVDYLTTQIEHIRRLLKAF
jgi:hypothetical protein